MKNTRQQIVDLIYEINGDTDHGECFYDDKMFQEYLETLDKLKELAFAEFDENKKRNSVEILERTLEFVSLEREEFKYPSDLEGELKEVIKYLKSK